jgi:uncharacterized protein (DUF2141 family)
MVNFSDMISQHIPRFFSALSLFLIFTSPLQGDELFTVSGSVTSMQSGTVYLQMVDEAGFKEKKDGFSRGAIIHIETGGRMTKEFLLAGIPPGTYGIRAFLDTNENGKIDFSLRGIEPWGTYRPVRPFMRRPRFREISFSLEDNLNDIEVLIK